MRWLGAYSIVERKYGQDAMANMFKEKIDLLKEGLPYMNDSNRIRFYYDLSLENADNVFDHDDELEYCLYQFLVNNWHTELRTYEGEDTAELPKLEIVVVQMMDYIKGELLYDEFAPIFKASIQKGITSFDESTMMSLSQFFWAMDKDRQDRLIILFLNHSESGYGVITHGIVQGYLDDQIRAGKLKLSDRLKKEKHNDENINKAHAEFIERIVALHVNQEYVLESCLSYSGRKQAHADYLAKQARRGLLSDFIASLDVDGKLELIDLWCEQSGAEKLLTPLLEDSSRKIRDKAAEVIADLKPKDEEQETVEESEVQAEFKLVDCGVYNRTDTDAILLEETETVTAKLNTFIGIRFTANESRYFVYVTHPKMEDGKKIMGKSDWTQAGKTNPHFAGWFFEEPEELLSGTYTFKIVSFRRELLVEKSITVETEEMAKLRQKSTADNSNAKYSVLVTSSDSIDANIICDNGEEFLRHNQPASLYNRLTFDAFELTADDLTDYLKADYPLLSPRLTEIIAAARPFGCYFYPALVNTADGSSEKYFAIKTSQKYNPTTLSEDKLNRCLVLQSDDDNDQLVLHESIITAIKEAMNTEDLSGFKIKEV